MKRSIKKYSTDEEEQLNIVSDYEEVYLVPRKTIKKEVLVKDFTYPHFKKIADKGPFTLSEWADLLYMSERTLHRYAKDGSDFNGLQIERILLLEKLIDSGNEFFGQENFKEWLSYKPFSLNGQKVRDSLFTYEGIQSSIDLIERIQQGIPA